MKTKTSKNEPIVLDKDGLKIYTLKPNCSRYDGMTFQASNIKQVADYFLKNHFEGFQYKHGGEKSAIIWFELEKIPQKIPFDLGNIVYENQVIVKFQFHARLVTDKQFKDLTDKEKLEAVLNTLAKNNIEVK